MVTKGSTQCWDNSTKGLDASTALEYVQSLRSLTNTANTSTLVALYQASESLFRLFDKVVLIEDGRCAYFGRMEHAKAYFERLGFECPPRWTTPDFLTSVSDPHARRIKKGWENRIPRSAEDFQRAYRKSDDYKATLADIDDFEKGVEAQRGERDAARSKIKKKNYTISFYKQVIILTHRQFLVMFGDRQSLAGKWGVIVFQALIIGSLFFNLPQTSGGVFTRGGVMFFILLFNALLALAELTAAFNSRPILMKHKSFCLCSGSSCGRRSSGAYPGCALRCDCLLHVKPHEDGIPIFHQLAVYIHAHHDHVLFLSGTWSTMFFARCCHTSYWACNSSTRCIYRVSHTSLENAPLAQVVDLDQPSTILL